MSSTLESLKNGGNSHLKLKLRKTRSRFIEQSTSIHGNKYGYDLVIYVRNEDYVIIECFKHGHFLQSPKVHLKGRGCKKCGGEKRRLTTSDFIERSNVIHSNKYNYSKSIYVKKATPITIICPDHGEFNQRPCDHLAGSGCPECSRYLTSWRRGQYQAMADRHGGNSKLYLARMHNDSESFFKIGITIFNLKSRYWGEKDYEVELISSVEMKACKAWDKERYLHGKLKDFKYTPLNKFGGHTECFSGITSEVKEFFGVNYA